jgi:multidrug efflux pump subunit AcrA (membrane-fusion protein)
MSIISQIKARAKRVTKVQWVLLFGVSIVGIVVLRMSGSEAEPVVEVASLPVVSLTTSAEVASGQSVSLVGTVRALTEASVTAERGGRVTSVGVSLGQSIRAGQVIATFENASERAAVLQAEGSYDAAIAASTQSGIGVDETRTSVLTAKNGAVTSIRSAYNTVNGTLLNNIDLFFSNPNGTIPGLRVNGRGNTDTLNRARVAYQTSLPNWQQRVNTLTPDSDLRGEIQSAKNNVDEMIGIVDTFITLFNQQSSGGAYTDAELQTFSTNFTSLRGNLIATKSSLDSSLTSIQSAEDAVRRAEVAASGGTTSAADAQIKQALGSLRAAQANLAKTILRSPINGTVNTLNVRTGDFINGSQPIALVANNNALEIITFIGESEQSLLSIGDTVLINGAFPGTVTQISPAIDPVTRKIEVRIGAETTELTNGDTVRLSKEAATTVDTTIRVPLTAVKFEADNGFMFVVSEENTLVQVPVMLGPVRDSLVEVTEGIDNTTQFVQDVRGLTAGDEVEVKSN